jgi:hypothetical protein
VYRIWTSGGGWGQIVEDGDQCWRIRTKGIEYGLMVENRYQWWTVETGVGG